MQRFKQHFSTDDGRFSGGHPHMNSYGKFVYGAPGTLCQYAQWRNEHIDRLHSSSVHRFLRTRDGDYFNILDAQMYLDKARAQRTLATLPLTLCDGRAGMFDA